ncbi:hypothetical protein HIM_06546 [Hirsutella minnesotensis 3608]|uniref:LysM domain-containing protein n=1 Tax=Hirsutella minnesotensis 3608 TaxID=1043627 RepID=A0A0F7ZZE8_9HYPO|nr:hypothetical protein HIM_06546 [Hirsutella minnesotensis 3608]
MEFCCTCTTDLSLTSPLQDDKGLGPHRRVECCDRIICVRCLQRNERFATYCPFCQVSIAPSPLPQRLRDPPAYTSVPSTTASTASTSIAPPPYTPLATNHVPSESDKSPTRPVDCEKAIAQDTLHFLDHNVDTIGSLSLRYGVPAPVLRRANNITSDHLLLGRQTILIPAEYYRAGISLSPRPVEGEEEELRKAKIRRFMTTCKVSDYDIALLYLEQSGYDLGAAVESYIEDDIWEGSHPKQKIGSKATAKGNVMSNRLRWPGL